MIVLRNHSQEVAFIETLYEGGASPLHSPHEFQIWLLWKVAEDGSQYRHVCYCDSSGTRCFQQTPMGDVPDPDCPPEVRVEARRVYYAALDEMNRLGISRL